MKNSVYQFKLKIQILLEKFLDGKFVSQSDENLKKLLNYLDWESETDANCVFPVFTNWVKQAVPKWSASRVIPDSSVIAFTLGFAAILFKNEDRFNELNNNNFCIKLINLAKIRQNEATSSVKLAYIELLSSFLEHKSGIEWMIACNFWEDILNLSLNSDDEIIEKSTAFVIKILEKSIDFDENFCENVIKKILLPLSEDIYKSIKSSDEISNEISLDCLQPTLKLISKILEIFLKNICADGKDPGVLLIFLKNFHLGERISDFMIIAQNERLILDLSKIMFMMQFLELYLKAITKSATFSEIRDSITRIENNFISNLYRGTFLDVIEFCKFGIFYWNIIDSKFSSFHISKSSKGTIHFSDQVVLLLSTPTMGIIMKYFFNISELEEALSVDDFRNDFVDKILSCVSNEFTRVFFFWRQKIINNSNIITLAKQSLHVLIESKIYLTKKQAVLIFQVIIYLLNDFINVGKEDPEKIDLFLHESSYIVQIFEFLGIFIEDFQIVLKDGIEATYVMDFCFEFLALKEWPSEVVVQIVKLVNIATAHYLAPNMALLVENTADSTMTLLGPFLYTKLLGKTAEVKKAALETIFTAARISNKKFPSLQKVLMDSELPTLVVKMSTCDGESFVRATAIKCLQEMIQVEEIWNNALKTEDLTQKMRDILVNETEGIVRVEAATFMCVAYEHQQFPRETLDRIYETMIYSSTTDLHWEVKVRALAFWDQVIKNHLQNQGMIDGTFPNVTFSKEHRKIVTLTDSEIRKRLHKVLTQLSSIGCLGVLMSAIKDDCDMEVSKTAVKITQRLVDLFKKYKVRSDCSAPTSPSPTENGMSATVSMSSGISVDESMDSPASSQPDFNEEIIEQIVNSKDVSLLKNVYAPSDYGSVSNYDIQVRKIVTPNEFLQFTQQDLSGIITEKKKWLNGIEDLGSLLDDMLKTYDDDVNNMDCY